jgi:hypothetical protein
MDIDSFSGNDSQESSEDRCSKRECLNTIQALSSEYPDRPITRDFFRQVGDIPDKDICFHFGNFQTFRQAAGLLPSRDEKKVYSFQGKEESVADLREFNKEKWSWKETYIRTNTKRFQTFVVVSDTHDIMCDPFYRRMSLQAAKDHADHIVLNGDMFDHPEISTFRLRPQEYRPAERYKWVHDYFQDFRNVAPDAQMDFVEGNHEYRLMKHLIDKSPYVMDVLNLHGWDSRKFLGLDEFEINYYSRSDFGTFTETDIQNEVKRNYYMFQDKVLFHHYPVEGMRFGMPGCGGHQHKLQVWPQFNAEFGAYNWYQTGGGSRRHVDYQVMMGQQWTNGFMTILVDTENKRNTVFNYVDCTGEFCWLNGKLYGRTEEEKIYLR